MVRPLRPTIELARITLQGSFAGVRGIGLVIGAYLPTVVLAGVVAGGTSGAELVGVYENLTLLLFFPLVLLLLTLLLGIPLFRDEIDRESLSYLLTRGLGKPFLVLGKYLGYLGAALVLLLPPVALTFGVVSAWGNPPAGSLDGVLPSLLAATTLGAVAYGAFFLVLGMVSRNALLYGLLYAFVWEYLIGGLSGIAPDLSVMHYLLSIPTFWVSTGPLATYATKLSLAQAAAAPCIFAVALLILAILAFRERGFVASPD